MFTTEQAMRLKGGADGQLYCFFNIEAVWGWVVKVKNTAALPSGKRPVAHHTGR